jgi:hypothetical protein
MSALFDAASALTASVAADRRALLEFVADLAAAFAAPLGADDGVPEDELRVAEHRLGFPLPAALREGYRRLGRRDDLTRKQDVLLTPDRLAVRDGGGDIGRVLPFRIENQGAAFWGVQLDVRDPEASADPPVLVRREDEGWLPYLDRMSLAWAEMVLSEVVLSGETRMDVAELIDDQVALVPTRCRRVALPDYPNWSSEENSPIRWYAAPGRLLRQDGADDWAWLFIRGQRDEDLAAMRAELPFDWLNVIRSPVDPATLPGVHDPASCPTCGPEAAAAPDDATGADTATP